MILDKYRYPKIREAAILIALDNGAINRDTSEEKVLQEFDLSLLFGAITLDTLTRAESDLSKLDEGDLEVFCIGDRYEAERIAFLCGFAQSTDDLLEHLFESLP